MRARTVRPAAVVTVLVGTRGTAAAAAPFTAGDGDSGLGGAPDMELKYVRSRRRHPTALGYVRLCLAPQIC
ncbi:hypothetical protein FB451DRAFT_1297578 [Mycena latifolia]|nr:hypothetical protein FB451DRAFT_1297578 [Mycena latifolia]